MNSLSKKFLSLFAVMMIVIFSSQVEAAKKIVAVMPMENVSGYRTFRVAEIMTEKIMAAIQTSGQYGLAERTQMGAVLREQGFQNIASDPSQAVEMGQMSGANYTVVGKVTMASVTQNATRDLFGAILNKVTQGDRIANSAMGFVANRAAKVAMDIRFVDNKTGEVVFVETFQGSKTGQGDEQALHRACEDAAEKFLKALQKQNPFMARVAEISGNEIYIDEGFESGLRQGETLIVARESSPIVIKGKIVGMKSVTVCKAKVIEVNGDYSICKVDKAGLVRQGDIVKRGQ